MDDAVAYLGNMVSNELESVEGKTQKAIQAKQRRLLNKYFGAKTGAGGPAFADPAKITSTRR